MGLDNGVILFVNSDVKIPRWLQKLRLDFYKKPQYEIYYWRKCYALRNNICNSLSNFKYNDSVELSIDDLKIIKNEIIKRYFTISGIKSWNTDSMNYWEYFPYRLQEGIKYIIRYYRLVHFLNKVNDYKLIFYDSY